ncbi:hypothetical protein RAB80_009806 [Fusarium oxysporum f. sp. vasinfectum]|nr:hypothetical protein RAB80_009806 [Fusarium oxysporum f. sp. vasinfectum]
MAGSRKKIHEILDRANISEEPDCHAESIAYSPGRRSADDSDADNQQHETCPNSNHLRFREMKMIARKSPMTARPLKSCGLTILRRIPSDNQSSGFHGEEKYL